MKTRIALATLALTLAPCAGCSADGSYTPIGGPGDDIDDAGTDAVPETDVDAADADGPAHAGEKKDAS